MKQDLPVEYVEFGKTPIGNQRFSVPAQVLAMCTCGFPAVITQLMLSFCEVGESGREIKEIVFPFHCSPVNLECW